MAAIITALLAAFGPLLGELLKKWLDGLLNRAAKGITASGDPVADATGLLAAAIRLTPRTRPFHRAMLRFMHEHAAAGTELGPAGRAEFAALAGAAEPT